MPTPRRTVPVSALDAALHRVGDRWSLLLVEALLPGPQRFNELLDGLDGLAPNILSARLKALEAEGVLAAAPVLPAALPGGLRAHRRGAELAGALRLLAHWGAQRSSARAPRRCRSTTPPAARRWRPAGDARPATGPWTTTRPPTSTTS